MRLLVLCTLAFAVSCANDTGYGALTTSWDQASTTIPAKKVDPETPKGKLTAAQAAEAMKSAADCAKAAKEYFSKDEKAGIALLHACAHRDDFIDLDAVIQGPWIRELRENPALQLIPVEVMAHRGGFVEVDTRACRQAGLPIYDVTTAMQAGSKAVGKLVVVRGAVTALANEKWGKGKSMVAALRESSWAEDAGDEGGAIPARDAVEDTGRIVYARVEAKDERFAKDRSLLFAMRLEGGRTYKPHEGEGEGEDGKTIIGVTVAFYDAVGHLRQ